MSEGQGSAGVPYLGSKISLISKAEIRYEGTLYTIDPQEATVALAKVRSFGTEDRPTDRPVAPRNEVFEFIIFRGQDIKDLNVCEPPQPQPTEGVPLDPAIVRSSQPPPNPGGATYATSSPGHPPGQMYNPSVQPLHFEQQPEFSPIDQHQQPSPSQQTSQGQQQQPSPDQHQLPSPDQHQLPPQGYHQQPAHGLHQQTSLKKPPSQGQLQETSHGHHQQQPSQGQHQQTSLQKPPSQGQLQETSHGHHQQQSSQGHHQQTSLKKPPTQGHPQETPQGHQQQPSQGQHRQSDSAGKEPPSRSGHSIEQAVLSQPPPAYAARPAANSQISTLPYGGKAAPNHNAQVRSDSPENAPNNRQRNNQQYPPYHGQGGRRGGGHHHNSNSDNRGRDERAPPPSYSRERNSGRVLIRGGPHRGGQWGVAPGGHQGGRSAEPLKFDTEFDFESSNAQFTKESIDKELKNLSLGDKPAVVGDKEEEEFEDEADDSEVIGDDPVYYNKAKSFFDNISCEATEPSKGQRFSWNEGRKLNSETFGIRENFRRNYRGRGNWRGGADHSGFGGGQGGGRWRGDGGYGNSGWNSRGRGGFQREAGGRYGGNAGANGQGRRNWGYDDRAQKDSHPRVDVRS